MAGNESALGGAGQETIDEFMARRRHELEHFSRDADVYRNHVGVGGRKHFSGGRIPPEFGGGGWKAKDLDWDMYGPIDRVRYGTSPATKAVVGPVLVGGVVDNLLRKGEDAHDRPMLR
jgi:hypothetical protein